MNAETAYTHFGECEACGNGLERPWWDRICFDCQQDEREQDEEVAQRLADEDHFLYGIQA